MCLLGQQLLARRRGQLDEGALGVEPVPGDLRGDRVAVGGECTGLDQDAPAPSGGAIEARQHQVQIHRERVHRDDFVGQAAGERAEPGGQILVIGHPRAVRVLVAVDGEPGPLVELLVDDVARGERQQAERVTAQVDELFAARIARQREARAIAAQRIGGVAGLCGAERRLRVHAAGPRIGYSSGRLGTASPLSAGTCSPSR